MSVTEIEYTQQQRRLAAIHEAGHVVVAVLHNQVFPDAKLWPEEAGGIRGRTSGQGLQGSEVSIAGSLAEYMHDHPGDDFDMYEFVDWMQQDLSDYFMSDCWFPGSTEESMEDWLTKPREDRLGITGLSLNDYRNGRFCFDKVADDYYEVDGAELTEVCQTAYKILIEHKDFFEFVANKLIDNGAITADEVAEYCHNK